MASDESGVAATQSHHQGRASEHEHGDASHIQQHSAHAAGGREASALGVDDVSGSDTGHIVISRGLANRISGQTSQFELGQLRISRIRIVICNDGEFLRSDRSVAGRSHGFGQAVGTVIDA